MWILKGSLLGILVFSVIFTIRFHRLFYHTIIGPGIVSMITVHSVFFWLGLVGCVLVGCAVVGYWSPVAR
jgi:hypothetical protein